MKNHYSITSGASYLSELSTFIVAQFREDFEANTGFNFRCWGEEFPAKMALDLLLSTIQESITESVDTNLSEIRRMDLGKDVIEYTASSESLERQMLKVFVHLNEDQEDYYDGEDTIFGEAVIVTMEAVGEEEAVKDFVSNFKTHLKTIHDGSQTSMIRWVFDTGHGHRDRTFQITKDWSIDRDYYPWIGSSLYNYYKAFLESSSQILVIYGPPGTGKTSFIRDLICEMHLNAFISYDLKVLTSDATFVRYLTDPIFDAVIIEDADDLLTSDRGEHNKVIAKILNISDGLIKLPKKKLIFTTNLPRVEDIDPAIIRPGRCFDVVEFRNLTKDEAQVIATKLDVELPEKPEGELYSLAEVFYEKTMKTSNDPFAHNSDKLKKRKVGFLP